MGTVIAFGTSYYLYHLEKAPITGKFAPEKTHSKILGRIRFISIDSDEEEIISKQSFDEIIKANRHLILPANHHFVIRISNIVSSLAKNINTFIPELNVKFQVYVIENSEPNAFVLPGGQIFVNTGLLSVARNDHGLATVLAHEVSNYFCIICKII